MAEVKISERLTRLEETFEQHIKMYAEHVQVCKDFHKEFQQEFMGFAERMETFEARETLRDEQYHQLVEKNTQMIKELREDTKAILQLWNDGVSVVRIVSAAGKLGKWLVSLSFIGLGAAYIIDKFKLP